MAESKFGIIIEGLNDVKIHVRKSKDSVNKHCFIAPDITLYTDIVQAIYNRFGKDLKIQKIVYKG